VTDANVKLARLLLALKAARTPDGRIRQTSELMFAEYEAREAAPTEADLDLLRRAEQAERERDRLARELNDLIHEGTPDAVAHLTTRATRAEAELEERRRQMDGAVIIRSCSDCKHYVAPHSAGCGCGDECSLVTPRRKLSTDDVIPDWCPMRSKAS